MGDKCKKILIQIQEKREKMLKAAKQYGYTSENTIRCSQELDQLIYEYQLNNIHHTANLEEVLKFPFKKMMLVMPKNILETKHEVLT